MQVSAQSHTQGSQGPALTKKEMLAQLKAQANARQQQEGPEAPSPALQQIEQASTPMQVRLPAGQSMRTASTAARFVNKLTPHKTNASQPTQPVHSFASVADPLVLAQAEVVPSEQAFNVEQSVPAALRQDFERFKQMCSDADIPAGITTKLWHHLVNDITIICVDTSFSMGKTDVAVPEQNSTSTQELQIVNYGDNRVGLSADQPATRMDEAKSRFSQILPILMAGNRQGIVQLKSYSNQQGIQLDMRHCSVDQALSRAQQFIANFRPDFNHTPSVSGYYQSCLNAIDAMQSGQVQSATIIEATDGEPNERDLPQIKQIYDNYYQNVVVGGQDYQRADGQRVPNREARTWNMDQNSTELMRQLSVLAGHFAIPTTFAVCTANSDEVGELNEVDSYHNTVAVLDDFKSEQQEVFKVQGPRIPFNLATYMAFNFIAPKEVFADTIDERPFTPAQLEEYLGYYPGHDAYVQNLDMTETAFSAQANRYGKAEIPAAAPTMGPGIYRPGGHGQHSGYGQAVNQTGASQADLLSQHMYGAKFI